MRTESLLGKSFQLII